MLKVHLYSIVNNIVLFTLVKEVSISNPRKIICVRHGESTLNAWHTKLRNDERFKKFKLEYDKDPDSNKTFFLASLLKDAYGAFIADHESTLTFQGRKQSRTVGYALMREGILPDVIISSPYARAMQTLEQMQKVWPALRQVPVEQDLKLREAEVGNVSLYGDFDLFFALNPDERGMLEMQDMFYYRFPNGENIVDVTQRLETWLQQMRERHSGKKIMVISHFITILSIRSLIESWDAEKFVEENSALPKINCAVSEFENKYGKLEVVRFNKKL